MAIYIYRDKKELSTGYPLNCYDHSFGSSSSVITGTSLKVTVC